MIEVGTTVDSALVPLDASHLPNFTGEEIFARILYHLEACLLDVRAIYPFGLPPITRELLFMICRLLGTMHHSSGRASYLARRPAGGLLLSTSDMFIDDRLRASTMGSAENRHLITSQYAILPAVLKCLRTWRLQTDSRARESLAGLAMNITSLAYSWDNQDLKPISGQSDPRRLEIRCKGQVENTTGAPAPGIIPRDLISNSDKAEPLGQVTIGSAAKPPNPPTDANGRSDYQNSALFRSGCSACRKPRYRPTATSICAPGTTAVSNSKSNNNSFEQNTPPASQQEWAKTKPVTRTSENAFDGSRVSKPDDRRKIIPKHVVPNPTFGHTDAQAALSSRSRDLIVDPLGKIVASPELNPLKLTVPPVLPRSHLTNSLILSTIPSRRVTLSGGKFSSPKLKSGMVRSKLNRSSENTAPLTPSSCAKIKPRILGQHNTTD